MELDINSAPERLRAMAEMAHERERTPPGEAVLQRRCEVFRDGRFVAVIMMLGDDHDAWADTAAAFGADGVVFASDTFAASVDLESEQLQMLEGGSLTDHWRKGNPHGLVTECLMVLVARRSAPVAVHRFAYERAGARLRWGSESMSLVERDGTLSYEGDLLDPAAVTDPEHAPSVALSSRWQRSFRAVLDAAPEVRRNLESQARDSGATSRAQASLWADGRVVTDLRDKGAIVVYAPRSRGDATWFEQYIAGGAGL